jgi:Asp-tRNA(Asn)/Glu-tRNA(Gln) amidotransferase A subunit family amidase
MKDEAALSRRRFLGASGTIGLGMALGGVPGGASVAAARPDHNADLVLLDAVDLSQLIRRRTVSCVEVMGAYLDHIEEFNPRVNAIVALQPRAGLLAQASERDRQLRRGEYLGWMHGFPHAVKDLAAAAGLPHTSGSPIYKDRIATTDALFVKRIKDAGAIIIGKTNTPEFGLGSQTYNPVWGTTTTPYDTSRTAGGSSGGAASALALRMLPVADGSDYMGSLRNPAAFNNVLGFRPTWGRVPAPGFIAQLSVTGPMGRTVRDVAMLLSVMAGPDAGAALDIEENPEIFTQSLRRRFKGTRIAWVGDFNGYLATEPGVLDLCVRSFDAFESLGCRVDAAMPDFSMTELWQTFLTWRWWSNLGSYDLYENPETRAQLKPELIWEIEHGIPLTALDISRANSARNSWYAAVVELFETYDFILAPSAQVFPFDADIHWPSSIDGRPMDTYHRWMETVAPWSLTDHPVMGMPVGFDRRGLPMGIQLVGRDNADLAVLQLAYAYEQATQWVGRVPPPMLSGA